ncbi:coiled-coil domain-containing protein 91 [Patella vulgata]|uniref:coiled-coil domain-containing protein 91 n=1 Tax=Patella vulgata TaxID=6465 RepID=UPI00217F2D4A|nr:coiled-coil domain-containing protein 91 [Patella vulgata]XP_050409555.1 coiled-coil domain-containing protein 91 [Patella vulgata]
MEDDDDFGDFGGFEGADENAVPAAGVEAGASPWAVFPPAVPQSQPDLLCAQNTFPTYLDPSGIISGVNSNNVPNIDQDSVSRDQIDNHNDVRQQAENVLDGTLAAGVRGLDLAAGTERTSNPADICLNTDEAREPSIVLPDLGVGGGSSLLATSIDRTDNNLETNTNSLEAVVNDNVNNIDSVNNERESASNNGDISISLPPNGITGQNLESEELQTLRSLSRRLEEELSRSRTELEQQRQRFIDIERRHSSELENIRSAGHDTLAVVVEQYKETTKTAILEQQETSSRYLQEKLKEFTEYFHQMMKTRNEGFTQQLESQKASEETRIKEAIAEYRQDQQKKFEEALAEERENHREEIRKTLEIERQASKEKLDLALQETQNVAAAKLEDEHIQFKKQLEEQQAECSKQIQTALEEEQEKMEKEFKERMSREQESSRVAMANVMQEARQNSIEFIREQRQVHSGVRQRHLASLDLFLESARNQIQLLQESDSPHSSAHETNELNNSSDEQS